MTPEQARHRGLRADDDVRPQWATHRIISSLSVSWTWPEDPPGKSWGMIVWLNREGQAVLNGPQDRAGLARPPKRTIDLRVGDEVMTLDGRWATISELYCYRGNWLTEEQAANVKSDGYLYELTAPAATESSA